MKRAVYISFEGDLPDNVNMSEAIAHILEHHAADIRNREHEAGTTASGVYRVSGLNIGAHWDITWQAASEALTARDANAR